MRYTRGELAESKRQIVSLLHKLRETHDSLLKKPNASKLKPQITLAAHRIEALEIAKTLIEKELNNTGA